MRNLVEGLEIGDLKRLVHPEIHIDEFKSKLGRDEDVCVISFKVTGKEPAVDLVNFVEKGYDWVIDADTSSGEMDDGDYIVFVECDRESTIPDNLMQLVDDLLNLTDQNINDWFVKYRNDGPKKPLSKEALEEIIPLNSMQYKQRYGTEEIDKLKAVAGVKVDTKAPKNDFTESLRIAAGIK
jgi:hypothetical protein